MATGGHVQLASSYAGNAWFPTNPYVLQLVRSGLESGRYNDDTHALLEDLKGDISLYTYLFFQLCLMIDSADPSGNVHLNSTWEHGLNSGELLRIVQNLGSGPGNHTFENLEPHLAARFNEAIVSASTAEVLSPAFGIEGEKGFTCALLRQLGLTLVAWNYPHVYQEALSKRDEKIDVTINRRLGFSPALLGISVAAKWGMPNELLIAMGRSSSGFLTPEQQEVAATLRKICEVGEALARAQNPDQYPSASADWDSARRAIENALGPNGMQIVTMRIAENCSAYRRSVPQLFVPHPHLVPEPATEQPAADQSAHNRYLLHCPPALRNALNGLYATLHTNALSKDTIDRLIKVIIPNAGFSRGCVYLVEPETNSLGSRLTIGDLKANEARELLSHTDAQGQNFMTKAFSSNVPIVVASAAPDGSTTHVVAGCLGEQQRIGVLYLEFPVKDAADDTADLVVRFKAIRQALNDCLNLY